MAYPFENRTLEECASRIDNKDIGTLPAVNGTIPHERRN